MSRLCLPFQEPHSYTVKFNYGTLDVCLTLDNNPTKTILYKICWIFNRLTKPVNGHVHPFPFGSLSIFGPHPDTRIMVKYGFLDIRWSLINTYTLAKIVKSPIGHLIFANHKKLDALRAKIGPISKVFWLYAMAVYLKKQKTKPNCSEKSIFKEDISINKWSYKVKVIKRYKIANRAISTHLTSQLLIRVTTSLNVIWVNDMIS